jgi:calcium-dependent protein kinase
VVKKHKLTEMEVYHELMMNELKVLEDVNHPQIPKTFELFEDEKNYYIVTELITGGNMLEKMLKLQTMSEVDTAKVVK